jgi:peroxiredoxin
MTNAPPEWQISEWLNTDQPLTLGNLKGRVVVACAFQMLCPGCVETALPQMREAHELFHARGVQVIGLHTVFEHHDAMTPVSLRAFLHEYRIQFPVGVDLPGTGKDPRPRTMRDYEMQGTPTLLFYRRNGDLATQHFGHLSDMTLGAQITALLGEPSATG